MSHISVQQILGKKGNDVWAIDPNDSALKALEFMAEKNVGALLVIKNDQLEGLFSERDYARKVILHGKASKDIAVSEVMTRDVIEATPELTTDECMSLMTMNRVRHLPVRDNKEIIGVVSIGDVVNARISEQEFEIKQMKSYIAGG